MLLTEFPVSEPNGFEEDFLNTFIVISDVVVVLLFYIYGHVGTVS